MLSYKVPVITRRSRDGAGLSLNRERPYYRLPAGFQMLFYGNCRPITILNHWLADKAKAKIAGGFRWDNTQRSYADDGAQGTIILYSLGKTWDDLTFKLITQMTAALMVGYSVWTRKKRHLKTVSRRVGAFLQIAKFARKHGYPMDDLPHEAITPKEVIELAAAGLNDIGADPRRVMPPSRKSVKVNPILECRVILDDLGPEILSGNADAAASESLVGGREYRNRLTAETSLYTGLRVDEVAHLTVSQILSLASELEKNPNWKEASLLVTHTKGTKPDLVLFPARLVRALTKYIETEREEVVDTARARSNGSYHDRGALFLNGIHANNRDVGRPLSETTISRNFSQAVARCGLYLDETKFQLNEQGELVRDGTTQEALTEIVLVPAHTFHDLRHTYAVVQYAVRCLRGEDNPLSVVKALLRHSLSQTTADLYLSWYHVHERRLSEKLAGFYAELRNTVGATQ